MPKLQIAGRPQTAREISDSSLVEQVYSALVQRILSGEYPSGLPISEVAVAAQLGVSRTPVHDALRQLVKDGLVTWERGRRARVAVFSPDDVYEVFELRRFLEGPAAELAAGRIDARQLVPLREAVQELRAMPEGEAWIERWAQFDELFHRTIAQASGNRRLAHDINRYRLLHSGFNRVATDFASLQRAFAEHLAIMEALENRDGALARQRMEEHIAHWQLHFVRQWERRGGER